MDRESINYTYTPISWLPFLKVNFRIFAGPFRNAPGRDPEFYRVCLQAENHKFQSAYEEEAGERYWPILDFDVPDIRVYGLIESQLPELVIEATKNKFVYFGCMGGTGRTGLVLALIAKACGEKDPVAYVREHYRPHAVETNDQKSYVAQYCVRDLRKKLFWPMLVRAIVVG